MNIVKNALLTFVLSMFLGAVIIWLISPREYFGSGILGVAIGSALVSVALAVADDIKEKDK